MIRQGIKIHVIIYFINLHTIRTNKVNCKIQKHLLYGKSAVHLFKRFILPIIKILKWKGKVKHCQKKHIELSLYYCKDLKKCHLRRILTKYIFKTS